VDPTGCGDAYRAAFLFGVARGLPLEVAGRMGSVLGARQVEVLGTQVLQVGLEDLRRLYAHDFGKPF
jgi:adenosine kinase